MSLKLKTRFNRSIARPIQPPQSLPGHEILALYVISIALLPEISLEAWCGGVNQKMHLDTI